MAKTWTIPAVLKYLLAVIHEMDRRNEQRFQDAEKAVNAALTTSEKAVAKAEIAAEKRFDATNEFRGQLADQAATLMPRREAEQQAARNAEKIADSDQRLSAQVATVTSRLDRIEARSGGRTDLWGYVVGAIGVAVSVAALVALVVR